MFCLFCSHYPPTPMIRSTDPDKPGFWAQMVGQGWVFQPHVEPPRNGDGEVMVSTTTMGQGTVWHDNHDDAMVYLDGEMAKIQRVGMLLAGSLSLLAIAAVAVYFASQ